VRSKKKKLVALEIDHREISVPEGTTVLRAAELNDIYIPSLCSHKDLSPFGGCRLCLVEIEGARGYPLACSMKVAEGMNVLTDTSILREMRKEILQLILSEHPSSCLICDETVECKKSMHTIRKAGVTTGCRYCPNDGQCELEDVVEKLGIREIQYPIIYRGYDAEHDDPFYDRDYNICILCGRCVRMCHEVRGTSVLAFKYRGRNAQIGPAYGRNHVEAGCEFCGACVSVCPTGTLADKVSKWDGIPDGQMTSTCPFCAIGCQVELFHKNGMLSKVHANLDPEVNDGQLCVRGRFSMPEATHHHERGRKPMLRKGQYFREVTWDEALAAVAGKLKDINPEHFLMVASSDLTNESLFTAQKFVRQCLGSNGIDSTAREWLPGGLGLWSKLLSLPISMQAIRNADTIIAVGLDSRFYFSIAGVEIRHALRDGAKLVTIDPRESNLSRYTDNWLRPTPGMEGVVLKAIADNLEETGDGIGEAAKAAKVDKAVLQESIEELAPGQHLTVVLGPTVFQYNRNEELIEALLKLAEREGTTFMPLYQGANTRGALELGAMPQVLPGGDSPNGQKGMSLDDVVEGKARPRVLYLVGEIPFFSRPDADYVIAQCTYQPPFNVDAFLPASSFAEAEGTLTNVEGRVQTLTRVESKPESSINGFMEPDWLILSKLARLLGSDEFKYWSVDAVLREIGKTVPDFPTKANRKARPLRMAEPLPIEKQKPKIGGKGKFLLVTEPGGFGHRGTDLSSKVEGLQELALEEGFKLNPEDLEELGIEPGDEIVVAAGKAKGMAEAKADPDCPRGAIYLFRPVAYGGLSHRSELEPLYRLRTSPVKVTVEPAGPEFYEEIDELESDEVAVGAADAGRR
jgi:predicted molibdopterin-dependent oxidoreductase YjgC